MAQFIYFNQIICFSIGLIHLVNYLVSNRSKLLSVKKIVSVIIFAITQEQKRFAHLATVEYNGALGLESCCEFFVNCRWINS